ncbi:hypothetical protein O6H91_03G054800 [Diphasiastrum complanatum]|uniref:Uncharacterized protein n=2 Tax=Diphasiastrum complanatum TaxID=34168 RepID=A0ACC2E6R9_DIPCM|nr:hypothetical protein O6H91_03G054800 [Diphasiastrum complanatum]KAJ7562089.1 hypothetical protein O6H91_03G054800 [Diphasiastrum complanatum]
MTEVRALEVHVVAAQDLKDVKLIGKMHTYVVAWVDPVRKYSTQVDKQGGTSPVWNEKLIIPVEQRLLDLANGMLMLEIYSHGSLSTKKVGSAQIPISEINRKNNQRMDYPVLRPSGKVQGTITISVLQGEQISVPAPAAAPPITAYPAYNSNPAPPPGPYPPYQYPPPYTQYPPAGGYPPQPPPYYSQPPPPGRNKFGGGLLGGAGAGLAGGLLGGFLLGDLVGSASDWGDGGGGGDYDGGGYDSGGGGDYGGGDFGGGGDF